MPYVLRRRVGTAEADATVRELTRSVDAELPAETIVRAAAAIPADHPMACIDAFAAATAVHHELPLLTGDPELLTADAPWRPVDLRA